MYFSQFEWFHPLFKYDQQNKFVTQEYPKVTSYWQYFTFSGNFFLLPDYRKQFPKVEKLKPNYFHVTFKFLAETYSKVCVNYLRWSVLRKQLTAESSLKPQKFFGIGKLLNSLNAKANHQTETNQLICRANQLTGSYMTGNIGR